MPELPEVETIVRGLRKKILNKEIKTVIVREDRLIDNTSPDNFREIVSGKKIKNIRRRGKYIIIELSQDYKMIIHLRMTGKLLVKKRTEEFKKHTHVIFRLSRGLDLRFNNLRKFGRIYLIAGNNWGEAGGLSGLGPEPLAEDFTLENFKERFNNRTTNIKALLLKQDFIAGMGNIYTDEALFEAGISPHRRVPTLTDEEIENLYRAIKKVLKLGIKYNGTTFSDYVNASGDSGDFQEKLKVYQHDGEECPRCHSRIEKEKIAGRGSHFCPYCQE